ncbi:MAG: hypothetical protein AB7N24_01140 [Dehalococcoidia bacterium]
MDYLDLAYERMDSWERTRAEIERANELSRLGLTSEWSPLAQFDSLLIRASKHAKQRQDRRNRQADQKRELVS